jgi:ABC-2 type transport system permease protein
MMQNEASGIRARTFPRKVLDTFGAYIRIDVVEDWMFPLSLILRYVAVVFPVLLYFFQSAFLNLGADQFAFMLIGISITTGLQDALTGLTGRLQFAQERGTLETYMVEPVPWAMIPLAMNIWRSLAGAVLACLMMTVGALLGAPLNYSTLPLALVVLFFGIVACNAIGTLAASFLVLFKRGEPVIVLYGLAAGVLGGALFPPSVLPDWLRWISYLVPHSYVIFAERQLLMENPPTGGVQPLVAIGILAVFCIVATAFGLRLFDRSLNYAKRLGTLGV